MTSLAIRMKEYEAPFGTLTLDPTKPFIVRCDGHHFSRFMKAFDKPNDVRMHKAMLYTTHDMVNHFRPVCGFTCSDEITLVFAPFEDPVEATTEEQEAQAAAEAQEEVGKQTEKPVFKQKPPNGGRVIKNVTLFAGFASTSFYKNLMLVLHEEPEGNKNLITFATKYTPHFDARAFNVPDVTEVVNNVKWRHLFDYRRNSIAGLAQKHFNAKALHGLHGDQMMEKLIKEKEVDWHNMPGWYKWGAFVKLQKYQTLVWVKGRKGTEPQQQLVTKNRTVTRVFEMKKQWSQEDTDWIMEPFLEEGDSELILDERYKDTAVGETEADAQGEDSNDNGSEEK